MDYSIYKILDSVKNPVLKKALISHGLHNHTNAQATLKYLATHPEVMNTTEPRMTMFTAEINEFLYSDNSFITRSVNDAAFAASGEIKLLNDSSAGPVVTKGRVYSQSLVNGDPAPVKTVKVRKNSSHEWAIEYFHTDPDVVTMELTTEVPYEVRSELLKAHRDVIMQSVANFTAVEWAQGEVGVSEDNIDPSAGTTSFVFTSGSTTRQSVVPGNTATAVKVVTKDDMLKVKKALQLQHVIGFGEMFFLPTVEQYDDILKITDFIDFEKTGLRSKLIEGIVGTILGIQILNPRQRDDWNANILYSYTALVGGETDLTKVEDTATPAASMASAGMAWVSTLMLRAEGTAVVFPWLNSPTLMGDVYATEVRYGAKKKRGDSRGSVMLLDNPF